MAAPSSGNALSGDDLEASVGAGQALTTAHVAPIQAHRDRSCRLRRGLDLALGAAVVGKLLRPELRFEPLSGFQNMPTNGFRTQPLVDGQHIMQQRTDRREGDLRGPLGLQVRQFWRRVHRQEFAQRAKRGLPGFLAVTPVPTGAAQVDIPEGGAKAQRVAALDRSRPLAMRTGPALCQVALQLLAHNRLLELAEDGLGFAEGESDVLHLVTSTIDGVKRHGEGARRGALNANLNGDSHGAHLS